MELGRLRGWTGHLDTHSAIALGVIIMTIWWTKANKMCFSQHWCSLSIIANPYIAIHPKSLPVGCGCPAKLPRYSATPIYKPRSVSQVIIRHSKGLDLQAARYCVVIWIIVLKLFSIGHKYENFWRAALHGVIALWKRAHLRTRSLRVRSLLGFRYSFVFPAPNS